MKNIVHRLKEHAEQTPDKTAIILGKRTISYSMFFNDVCSTATNLQKRGFKRGDRILLLVPMSYDLYRILFAIFSIGATAVFVETWADRNLINEAISKSSPEGFIAIAKAHFLRALYPSVRKIPIKCIPPQLCGRRKCSSRDFHIADIEKGTSALVTFTTGSTGHSKAVKKTHAYLMTQHAVISKYIRPDRDAVDLTTLPVFFLNNIGLGITSVIPSPKLITPNAFHADSLVEIIRNENVSTSVGAPAFFGKLADYLHENKQRTTLKTIYIGGAPVFPKLASKLVKALPDTVIKVLYGSTEVLPISLADARDVIHKTGDKGLFVGKPVKEANVRILKTVAGPIQLKKGESITPFLAEIGDPGEVIVKGIHVLTEYLNAPELFALNKIVENDDIWHRTGDSGRIDENGNLYLLGKEDNKIQSPNGRIYPFVVEQAIIELQSISYASCFQAEDKVFIAIETSAKLSKALEGEIYDRVSRYGLSESAVKIVAMQHIPRDSRHNSKVNYQKLKDDLVTGRKKNVEKRIV